MSRPSPLLQNFLYLIKKFLCDDWLVFAFINFFGVAKMSVVKWVRKKIFCSVFMPNFSASSQDSFLRQKVGNIFQTGIISRVKLKSLFDNFRFLFIHNNCFGSRVVDISDWSLAWKYTHGVPATSLSAAYFATRALFNFSKPSLIALSRSSPNADLVIMAEAPMNLNVSPNNPRLLKISFVLLKISAIFFTPNLFLNLPK